MNSWEKVYETLKANEELHRNRPIADGDLRRLTLEVDCIFHWSDKIVADADEDGNVLEYTSGYIMTVVTDKIVYKDQPSIFLAQVFRESPPNDEPN